jgi:hypothetical protein
MKHTVLAAVAICLLVAAPSFACNGMCFGNECRSLTIVTNMSCSNLGGACIEQQESCSAAVAPEPEADAMAAAPVPSFFDAAAATVATCGS